MTLRSNPGKELMALLRSATLRRSPWIPLALTLSIALTAFLPTSPLRGLGGAPAVPAYLRLSPHYLALAPWCGLLDTLTLMSVRQHFALVGTLLSAYIAWRIVRHKGNALSVGLLSPPPASVYTRGNTLARELAGFSVFVAALVATYALGALLPRPMASLRLLVPDALAVDFHSHTRASWDGRRNFSPESNRAWHHDAGFNAVYISDHGTLAGVIEGEARNPRLSHEGTVILPAVEVRCDGQHIVILGATIHQGSPDCASAMIPASSSFSSAEESNTKGMINLLTIPARFTLDRPIPRAQAIEIADAAPSALDQMERDGALIRRIARRNDLAVVASSNNHGWGRTAAAWSVLRIEHWGALTPKELDSAIRARLSDLRGKSVYVVERRRIAPPASTLELMGTVPEVGWRVLTTLSPTERLSWVIWTWTLWALSRSRSSFGRFRRRYLTRGA